MKIRTETDYIHSLIAEGEHQQQDFKFEISDARKTAKTLSAFANTDGGRLLIGVKDNGKIAGRNRSMPKMYRAKNWPTCASAMKNPLPIPYNINKFRTFARKIKALTI